MLFDEIITSLTDDRVVYPALGQRIPNQGFKPCELPVVGRKTCPQPVNGNPGPNGLVEWCIFGPPVYMGVDEEGNDCVARP